MLIHHDITSGLCSSVTVMLRSLQCTAQLLQHKKCWLIMQLLSLLTLIHTSAQQTRFHIATLLHAKDGSIFSTTSISVQPNHADFWHEEVMILCPLHCKACISLQAPCQCSVALPTCTSSCVNASTKCEVEMNANGLPSSVPHSASVPLTANGVALHAISASKSLFAGAYTYAMHHYTRTIVHLILNCIVYASRQ